MFRLLLFISDGTNYVNVILDKIEFILKDFILPLSGSPAKFNSDPVLSISLDSLETLKLVKVQINLYFLFTMFLEQV